MYYDCEYGEKSASKFHKACDNKGATITIFHGNQYGTIHGGYTSVSWGSTSKDKYKKDENAFLFTVGYRNDAFEIHELKNSKINKAVCHNKNKGPCFGESDVCINYSMYHPPTYGFKEAPPSYMRWRVNILYYYGDSSYQVNREHAFWKGQSMTPPSYDVLQIVTK